MNIEDLPLFHADNINACRRQAPEIPGSHGTGGDFIEKYVLREYQKEAVWKAVHFFKGTDDCNAIEVLPTGCHAKGTKILMATGNAKKVEQIKVGEYIMAPNGDKRKVLNLYRGIDDLYRITPHRGGDPFIVNGNHILSLMSTNEGRRQYPSCQKGGEITFIKVNEYVTKSKSYKHLRKLHKSKGLSFNKNNLSFIIPPYFLGLLLGDGYFCNGCVSITSADNEIIKEVKDYCHDNNLRLRISVKKNNKAVGLHIVNIKKSRSNPNDLHEKLKILHLSDKKSESKFIPDEYKITSKKNRLEILAGLIDTDGYHDGRGGYDYISKSYLLAHDVAFIAKSLGFSAHEKIKYCACQTGAGDNYYRVSISGNTDIIPCRIKRKQAPRRLINKNNLVSGFKVEHIGKGEFFGFELDGDHLYLTDDFFIHHNSGKSLIIANIIKELDAPTLVFQPSKEILEQNIFKLRSYGFKATIFSASMNEKEISNTTFATIGSAINHPEIFSHFKYIIIDECHFVNSKGGMYAQFLSALKGSRVLGLTATPYRLNTDRYGGSMLKFLTRTRPRIFEKLIYFVQNRDLFDCGYLAKIEYKQTTGFDASKLKINSTGADYDDRSVQNYYKEIDFKNRVLNTALEVMPGRKNLLIFTRFVEEADFIAKNIPGAELVTAESSKKDRERILNGFKNGEIKCVTNVGILTTGFDYPELETVLLARPTMSLALYYQMIGRGIRPHPEKKNLLVIDMCQNYDLFGDIKHFKIDRHGEDQWFIKNEKRIMTNVYYQRREN